MSTDPRGPEADDSPTGTIDMGATAAGRHAAPDDSADRGTTRVEDVVVEKIAAVAAGEVEHVGGAARRVLGVPTGREQGDGRPRVTARVSADVVSLDVRLSIVYPASVRAVSQAVRAHVTERVEALTALRVNRVELAVAALTGADTGTAASTGRVVA